nr:hypothetical protein GCM10020092_005630 [Actinoplanes digitatis]
MPEDSGAETAPSDLGGVEVGGVTFAGTIWLTVPPTARAAWWQIAVNAERSVPVSGAASKPVAPGGSFIVVTSTSVRRVGRGYPGAAVAVRVFGL